MTIRGSGSGKGASTDERKRLPQGSHLRNWRPGDDDADELAQQRLRDALRDDPDISDRRLAKLLDMPRTTIWQMRLYAAIPDGLFDRLIAAGVGTKALIWMGRHFRNGGDQSELPPIEWECCPNCGHKLRARSVKGIPQAIDILNQWIDDGQPDAPQDTGEEGMGEDTVVRGL